MNRLVGRAIAVPRDRLCDQRRVFRVCADVASSFSRTFIEAAVEEHDPRRIAMHERLRVDVLAGKDETVQLGERGAVAGPACDAVRRAMRRSSDERLETSGRRRRAVEPNGGGDAAHAI